MNVRTRGSRITLKVSLNLNTAHEAVHNIEISLRVIFVGSVKNVTIKTRFSSSQAYYIDTVRAETNKATLEIDIRGWNHY